MTPREEYARRMQRIDDAVALRKPDRVPLMPFVRAYPYVRAGHTMAQAMRNAELAAADMKQFVLDFEPDAVVSYTASLAGADAALNALGIRFLEWPGREGGPLQDNAVLQPVEQPVLGEDDYDTLEENLSSLLPDLHSDSEAVRAYGERGYAFEAEMEELGFPMAFSACTAPAFDVLSGCLRGTLDLMMDLYTQDEEVDAALELLCPLTVQTAVEHAARSRGRFVYIPLQKGMEGYLGLDQYEDFYFPTLKKLTEALLSQGLTPMLYAEGPYTDRMELLRELPQGVVLHFDNVNMAEAKRLLGGEHCLSGGFYAYDLVHGSPENVSNYLKFLLDTVAADGGYIFDFGDKWDDAKPENLEAMLTTLRDYGKY